MAVRPGTVSKILWHFTGGPLWDSSTNKQLKELKPAIAGYEALNSILRSMELRTGNYHEIVKVIVPEKRKYNLESKVFETLKNYPVEVKSSPTCCVADIPLQHIAYHANRYGKIAIGFHREAIIKSGFNPVMYTLESAEILNSIYQGYSAIDDVDPYEANDELESLEKEAQILLDENGIDEYIDISDVSHALDYIAQAHGKISRSYSDFLAFIKTFDENEFDSIYCEREWRSTNKFKFNVEDIAIIVLPKEQEGFRFYEDFLAKTDLPRTVTIAIWEDLIEH